MTRRRISAAALTAILAAAAAALAQPPSLLPPPPPLPPGRTAAAGPERPGEAVNLSVAVTISRYREDEPVSSVPHVLSFTSDTAAASSLSLEAEVPWEDAWRSVGTQMEGFARGVGDDRYEVTLVIEETSIVGDGETPADAIGAPGMPVFASFASRNTLVLRDGQSHRYTAGANRVTGERIQVDVALTVLDRE